MKGQEEEEEENMLRMKEGITRKERKDTTLKEKMREKKGEGGKKAEKKYKTIICK